MQVKLKPSYQLAAVLAAAHAGAITAVLLCDVRLDARLALVLAVVLSFVLSLRRSALLTAQAAVVALEWNEDGDVNFQTRDGTWHRAQLLRTTFVTPLLTIVNLRADDRPRVRHAVLMADSAERDAYRRLRVRLQWGRTGYA